MPTKNTFYRQDLPCFIVAELSANHNGSLAIALETVKAAKRAGADAIKLQTYTADTITLNSTKDDFQIKGTLWHGQNLHQLYQQASTPWQWHSQIFATARQQGLVCFSSPFDFSAVDWLENLACPIYKIASFEITDIPLIEYVASKGKPIIISTGIASKEDIELALATCYATGNSDVALLKCTSSYPAPIAEANLRMIKDMAQRFQLITGLSDHSIGSTAPIVATCCGAKIIEKHFILDNSIGGPDAAFSLNEADFTAMVKAVREAEDALGEVNYQPTAKQIEARAFSRSLYIVEDVKAGDKLSSNNIRSIRPGYGLHPRHYHQVIGKQFIANFTKGERLTWDKIK